MRQATMVPMLDRLPNVLVVRTLSKAFRLAGVRLGYAIGHPELLEGLRAVRLPYAQSAFAQVAATIAVRRHAELLSKVPVIVAERDRLAAVLASLPGVEVSPSQANFVLFRHPDPDAALASLAEQGVVVRDFRHLIDGCLRVTAGTPEDNDAFLEALAALA